MSGLAAVRKKAGFSQQKLSEMTGLSQAFISEIERGKKEPSLKTLSTLSFALDCEIEDLIPELVEKVKTDLQSRGIAV